MLTKSNRTEIQTYKVEERTFGTPRILLEHRWPKLCGSSLDFEFIKKCIKINKIRPKSHFLTKIEIQMTRLVFLFCFLLSLRLQSSTIQNLILNVDKTASKWHLRPRDNKNKTKTHFYFCFCPKMEFRTYFVYFQIFSYKFKSNKLQQSLGCLWLAKSVEGQKRVELRLKPSNSLYTDAVLSYYLSFRSFSFHPRSTDFEEKIEGLYM